MGTCFSCCRVKIMRKHSQKSTFLLTESANEEEPHDNEECMELEQRAEGVTEIQTCTNEVSEVTKPNKLVFRKPHFSWLRNDNQLIPGSHHRKEMKSPADSVMPLLHRESSFTETCSFTGSQKWDQLSNGATPGSSVDLEWENEIGFNSANFGATEEMQWTVLTENTNNSWRSSPVSNSNGLEWDGDFTTIDISEIVTGTQKLTSDLDNVDQDYSEDVYRDIENNN